jgi:hypothetical protein
VAHASWLRVATRDVRDAPATARGVKRWRSGYHHSPSPAVDIGCVSPLPEEAMINRVLRLAL